METESDGADGIVHYLQAPRNRVQLDVQRGQLARLVFHEFDKVVGDVADVVRDVLEGFDEVLALALHEGMGRLAEMLFKVRDCLLEALLRGLCEERADG